MAKTNNSETSVEEKLRALFDLQLIDSRLDEIQNTRGELPLEVEDLEDDIVGLNTRKEKIEAEIAEVKANITEKKEAIKHSETLIKRYKDQQENVRNNREFEALNKELEFQELEIQLSNKRVKEFKVAIENKKEKMAEVVDKINSYTDHLAHKKSELEKIVQETEKEEKALREKSEEFSIKIEPRLLKAYNKIRSAVNNGLAVVSVERGASAGSFFTIPAQRQIEIAQRKKIMIDEHSGRILVDSELANEEKEKMSSIIN